MEASFLSTTIQRFYPSTSEKIQELLASNKLVEKLAQSAYLKIESAIQQYADVASKLKIITRIIPAWKDGKYTDISYTSIFICAAILMYVISPIDLFPDFIPIIGGLDDAILVSVLIKTVDKEIERFLIWENENK